MALAANSKNSGRMISSMRSASLRNKSGDNNKNCSNYHRFKMLGQKKEKVGSVKLMKIEKKNYLRCNKNLKILKDQQIRAGSIKRDVPAFLHSPVVPKNEPVSQHEKDKNLLFREVIDISDGSRPASIIK